MDKTIYLSAALVVVLLAMSVTLSTIAQQPQQQIKMLTLYSCKITD
ncbi:MAG TPA: hypothetical protein VJ729_13930 [Nitrososphaeraceae archaeon]|nr:hypothetical protein [Nitrososphaeraceae archaeon]